MPRFEHPFPRPGPNAEIPNGLPAAYWIVVLCVACFAADARGQPAPGAAFVTRSQSGQFVIHANQPTASFVPNFNSRANTNVIRLDPARLTVAAERIKQLLWRNLATTAPWRGKIHLFLHPANGT